MPEAISSQKASDYAKRIRERHQGLNEVFDCKTITF